MTINHINSAIDQLSYIEKTALKNVDPLILMTDLLDGPDFVSLSLTSKLMKNLTSSASERFKKYFELIKDHILNSDVVTVNKITRAVIYNIYNILPSRNLSVNEVYKKTRQIYYEKICLPLKNDLIQTQCILKNDPFHNQSKIDECLVNKLLKSLNGGLIEPSLYIEGNQYLEAHASVRDESLVKFFLFFSNEGLSDFNLGGKIYDPKGSLIRSRYQIRRNAALDIPTEEDRKKELQLINKQTAAVIRNWLETRPNTFFKAFKNFLFSSSVEVHTRKKEESPPIMLSSEIIYYLQKMTNLECINFDDANIFHIPKDFFELKGLKTIKARDIPHLLPGSLPEEIFNKLTIHAALKYFPEKNSLRQRITSALTFDNPASLNIIQEIFIVCTSFMVCINTSKVDGGRTYHNIASMAVGWLIVNAFDNIKKGYKRLWNQGK